MSDRLQSRHGLTVVELLIVIVTIGLLAVVVLPALSSARETARRTNCANNLKQIGLALQNYHDIHQRFPAGWMPPHPSDECGADSWAWSVAILPFSE